MNAPTKERPPEGIVYPVLPLRDIVVFPGMIVPLFVGREKSVKALEEVMKDDKQILLIAQKNASQDDPGPDDIYEIGTLGTVLQLLKLPDDTVKVLVEGGKRVRITGFTDKTEFFEARAVDMEEVAGDAAELQAAARTVVSEFENYVKLNKKVPPEVVVSINKIEEPGKLADTISAHLALKVAEKQQLLELDAVSKRLERILGLMEGEIGVLQVEKKIRNRVKRQMEKTQREYYLNEQMKAIQKELGETEDGRDEVSELEKRINEFFKSDGAAGVRINVLSFGYKYGIPVDSDLVLDCRFIPNPHWVPELRPKTGQSSEVSSYVLTQEGVSETIANYSALLKKMSGGYLREGKKYITLAVGCTGGKHRSVAIAEELAKQLSGKSGDFEIEAHAVHRDVGRE